MLHFGQLDQSPEDNPQKHPSRDNKSALGNFTTFTGKHLCQSLFLACNLLKKRLWHRCFPVNVVKFLRTPFFIEQNRLLEVSHLWNSLKLLQQPENWQQLF